MSTENGEALQFAPAVRPMGWLRCAVNPGAECDASSASWQLPESLVAVDLRHFSRRRAEACVNLRTVKNILRLMEVAESSIFILIASSIVSIVR